MKKRSIIMVIVIGFCLIALPGGATVYVSDKLEVPLRTGPSPKDRIINMFRSGQEVVVMSEENGWSYVRSIGESDDKKGWILSRYLMNREPWETRIKAITIENARLRETLYPMEGDLRELKTQNTDLTRALTEKTEALEALRAQHESLRNEAAGFLDLKRDYGKIQSDLTNRETKLAEIIEENGLLRSSHRNRWFLTGALVLLVGLLIGLTIGRREKKHASKLYL